ncbi:MULTISPECIES: response regulator transcription factor [unclassified Nocardioides]|uniref:helix-turn-helix domain-containing protein n=1 Tax=unclassified Nocardioides TaxID=2615069 RepID=UPI0002E01F9B|nr:MULTISPECIES: response regulator transcription factor [unclassified Nocardioides]
MPETVLTEREDEVLKLIAEGSSSKDIATALTISIKTVERHRANILAKLGMRDRTQLTRYAIRAGLIDPDSSAAAAATAATAASSLGW